MDKKFIIIGLRASHPVALHDRVPGYLEAATEFHRYGFQLPDNQSFYAWGSNPWNAIRFTDDAAALACVERLCSHTETAGWNGPFVVASIYLPD